MTSETLSESPHPVLSLFEQILNPGSPELLRQVCTRAYVEHNALPLLQLAGVPTQSRLSSYAKLELLARFISSPCADLHFTTSNVVISHPFTALDIFCEGVVRVGQSACHRISSPPHGSSPSGHKLVGDRLHLQIAGSALYRETRGLISESWAVWRYR